MAEQFPQYVTDGHHIYLWHEEYEPLLKDGRLRASEPPPPRKARPLSARERTKLEAQRRKALQDAEAAVQLFRHTTPADLEDVFGAPPKDE